MLSPDENANDLYDCQLTRQASGDGLSVGVNKKDKSQHKNAKQSRDRNARSGYIENSLYRG